MPTKLQEYADQIAALIAEYRLGTTLADVLGPVLDAMRAEPPPAVLVVAEATDVDWAADPGVRVVVATGCEWLDEMGDEDRQALAEDLGSIASTDPRLCSLRDDLLAAVTSGAS